MAFFIISFIAGALTVLAPCILPLLPVILGGAVAEAKNRRRPLVIVTALAASVFVFTLLLKGSTALISVSPSFWTYISAAILFIFGLTLLFPITWAKIVLKIPGHNRPDAWLNKGYQKGGSVWADIVVGAALGPVFTTCSPTFFVILATVLPASLATGIVDLLAYIIGLSLALLLIAAIGQRLVDRLDWLADPTGWFKRLLGVLFVALAVLIAFGFDKQFETAILNSGFFDVTKVEQSIKQSLENPGGPGSGTASSTYESNAQKYIEIAKPAGFVNSAPFKLADIVGKKVILIDFVDYSCINCERTFPYLKDWYAKYKDQGLEIVAIHTPEFAFEKDKANVEKAAQMFGLTFPIVLDNDYGTWSAYQNQYWPHKYLIDIHGDIIFDHIGEGGYDEMEMKIVDALNERKQVLGETGKVTATNMLPDYSVQTASPETYFGAMRNEYFGNGRSSTVGEGSFTVPTELQPNTFYLGGPWSVKAEYAETGVASVSNQPLSEIAYVFSAAKMYIVAEAPAGSTASAKILIDGKPITVEDSGSDIKDGMLKLDASRLYNIYSSKTPGTHRVDIIFTKPGVKAYTFTFG